MALSFGEILQFQNQLERASLTERIDMYEQVVANLNCAISQPVLAYYVLSQLQAGKKLFVSVERHRFDKKILMPGHATLRDLKLQVLKRNKTIKKNEVLFVYCGEQLLSEAMTLAQIKDRFTTNGDWLYLVLMRV